MSPNNKGLMDMESAPEVDDGELKSVDSDLVYTSAMAMLNEQQMKQQTLSALQGARDVGTAVGKMAAVLITRITDELDSRDLPVSDSSVLGKDGALAKVLTAIYQVANESGLELRMEESLIQAYEVASADLEQLYNG